MYLFRTFQKVSVVCLLAIATVLPLEAVRAESIFEPYKASIREQMPPGLSLRLPDKILLSASQQGELEDLTVRVFVNQNPSRMTVSLHSCKNGNTPCLLGSFVTEQKSSPTAQAELVRHQRTGLRITLKGDVFGYVLDNQTQSSTPFASVMWTQDNMIYTLSFPQTERQNMLYMALSMANAESIFRP
jgi:hypothetical protein